jgi:branched-chain amino acid transport system substrate-binding protein
LITRLLGLLLFAASGALAQSPPIVVGAVVSQTGAHAGPAEQYSKALQLWQEQVNGAGGLLGRKVELRLLDDGSDAVQAGRLYAKLIAEKADALIGPFGSAAALMANAEAEKGERVIVNGAAPAGAVEKRAGRYAFQAGFANRAYGEAVIGLAKKENLRNVILLARDDAASREMAEGARDAAARLALGVGEIVFYRPGTTEFDAQVSKAAGAEAWIAFGDVRDAADMARTFRRLDYAPRFFFASAAAQPAFIKLIGQDAEHTLAAVEYDPRMATPGNREFVAAYRAKWSSAPGPAAAQGYAAASTLAEAVRRAGAVDPQKLRAAFQGLEPNSVLPPLPVVVQIQKGRPEVVWPEALKTVQLNAYPQWSDRKVLKK